ncbi:MAG: hypothetical protein K2M46_11925 [Lachnospiraceae bacterium]|nr:hypothetical protein [Lachnospiraceae bacterium]
MFSIYQYKYAVIGGDLRQNFILRKLSQHYQCLSFGVPGDAEFPHRAKTMELAVKNAENIILPIPMQKGGNLNMTCDCSYHCKELLGFLHGGQCIFAGCIPREYREFVTHRGVTYYDYMEQSSINIYNSIATAEGLIAEILTAFPCNLHDCKVLVLGYGSCGKTLAGKLKALNANVCVCARREDARMEAYSLGMKTADFTQLSEIIGNYPLILNTVPAKILDKNLLAQADPSAMLFDIASFPYGIDVEAAQALSLDTHICMSLPAKYSPVSSAEILTCFILKNSLETKFE